MSRPIIREGAKVSIGMVEKADIPLLYACYNDPDVMRYLKRPDRMISLEEAYSRYESLGSEASSMMFAISVNSFRGGAHSDLAGTVSATSISHVDRTCVLRYVLLKDHWGKGYATEAVALATNHLFGTCNLRTISAHVCEPDTASIRVLEKNRFRPAVRLTKHVFIEGHGYVDELIYELHTPGAE